MQFNVRMPLELREKLNEAAIANGRSATAELISRLEKSFDEDSDFIINKLQNDVSLLEVGQEKLYELCSKLQSEIWDLQEATGTSRIQDD